ncbi:MAG TPA: MarR family winged helix-turn-helix transcriptional regulator, partial [Planctomycetota bacterium]|nr:MarR family winged helix-turn-helix transcriptional regulator [Planctomycetota bacterium]
SASRPAPAAASRPDPAALIRRVGRALSRLEREQICCGEVTRQQFDTLRALDESGGLTTGQVARRLGIDLSTASRNLAVLARERLIRRRAGADDARAVRNVVTARGRGCVESLCCEEDSAVAAVLGRLPRAEQASVMRALELLAEALDGVCGGTACCAPPAPRPPAVGSILESTRESPRKEKLQ